MSPQYQYTKLSLPLLPGLMAADMSRKGCGTIESAKDLRNIRRMTYVIRIRRSSGTITFPVLNSPNISVMLPVSIPPPSNLSSSLDPVLSLMISAL